MNNLASTTTTTLSGIISRNTSAEFSVVNIAEGNIYKVYVSRYDVTFDEFLNILDEMELNFGEQYIEFDEDGMIMTFTIEMNDAQ